MVDHQWWRWRGRPEGCEQLRLSECTLFQMDYGAGILGFGFRIQETCMKRPEGLSLKVWV